MSETAESAADRSSESVVTTPDTTSTNEDIETGQQSEPETTSRPAVDSTDPAEQRGLPLDETFELLRNQRRRYVLQYLEAAEDEEVTLSELAEQIAAWENDKEVRLISSSERKRVYVGLYQCHLPKMDGMNVISFNKPRGLIETAKYAHLAEPYLQRAETPNRPSWDGPVLSLSIGGAALLPVAIILLSQSALALGVAVFVALAATVWSVATLRGVGIRDEVNSEERRTV